MRIYQTSGFLSVAAALIGNVFVASIKFIAAVTTGSSVLFSEAIHSVADTLNQVLILIGLKRSTKLPDEDFIYGYGYERFFWALISACGIFFIGAGITSYSGIISLIQPKGIIYEPFIIFVLLASLIIESITFGIAYRELKHRYPKMTLMERIREGDPSTLAVFFEDGVAVLGVFIAFISLWLTFTTGHYYWDGIGSIIIGVLLGAVAITLIIKNKNFLIGKAIPDDLQEHIIEMLEADPAIEHVIDFKSIVLDIGVYRIKCEIEFNGYVLLKEIYKVQSLREQFNEVKDDYEEFKKFCVDYADRIPRLVGKKIDEIERRIKLENPGVKYIDIEIN